MPLAHLTRTLMICVHFHALCSFHVQAFAKVGPSSSVLSFPALHHYLLTEIFPSHPPRLHLVPLPCASFISMACSAVGLTALKPQSLLNLTVTASRLWATQRREEIVLLSCLWPQCLALCLDFQVSKWSPTDTHAHMYTHMALFGMFPSTQKVEYSKVKIHAHYYHPEL